MSAKNHSPLIPISNEKRATKSPYKLHEGNLTSIGSTNIPSNLRSIEQKSTKELPDGKVKLAVTTNFEPSSATIKVGKHQ